MLDQARQRARDLNQKGALFPWRTISGEEASAYYAAGTAQYHINAAIAYALKKYVDVTDDQEFLREYGAEMLVETARLLYDLGFFSDRAGGKFCIHSVTGPDEYSTVVNNNTYTNLMARENLWYAAGVIDGFRERDPAAYRAVAHECKLDAAEPAEWRRAADNMYVPYDERTKMNPQDDSFLEREVWDLKNTPKEKFPLLLHYHPLVIYRYQVIKQADIVLAMFLLGNEFSAEQKKRNFDYYDPLTTGDSSLSASIQSIVASEIGKEDAACHYLDFAILMDIADVAGNASDGVHIASAAGAWMALVFGFGGVRDFDGQLTIDPRLPQRFRSLGFSLRYHDRQLRVRLSHLGEEYTLEEGEPLDIVIRGVPQRLAVGQPIAHERPEQCSARDEP